MSAIHIHRVPTEVVGTVVGEPRWCFHCRKRSGGLYALHATVEPGYYGPHWSYACDNCHQDCRLGFGWEWLDGTAGPRESDGPYCARQALPASKEDTPFAGWVTDNETSEKQGIGDGQSPSWPRP